MLNKNFNDMKSVSREQKPGWYKQFYEGRKKVRRKEKYYSCFVAFVAMLCLVIVACVLSLFVVGIIEAIHYLWRSEKYSDLFFKRKNGRQTSRSWPTRKAIHYMNRYLYLNFSRWRYWFNKFNPGWSKLIPV